MEDLSVVIMERDPETGFLSKELGSYNVALDINMIDRIFVTSESDMKVTNLYITIPGDFEDWEFNAILDNYNIEQYSEKVLTIGEDEDSYNPTWIIKFDFIEDDSRMEGKLNELLEIHDTEVKRVLEDIKGMEEDYKK